MKKLIYLMVVIAILGLIVSGCSIPLKSVVPTSEKGNPKPELGAPTLERITFIHYAKPNDRSKPVWDDSADKYKLLWGGIKWFKTISYKVSTNEMPDGLGSENVRKILEVSSETWDAEVDNKELFSMPSLTDEPVDSGDNENTVGWDSLNPGIIAICSMLFYPATKEIVESDIVFNTYYTWGFLDPANSDTDKMDLQNIATHEFGHNGLNDLYMPPSTALTMYGYSGEGETDKRDLGTGDRLGIQKLYGLP